MTSLRGGQRALRPQARFGGQPPQAALRPEMAALPCDCQQMCNNFYAIRGVGDAAPYNQFVAPLHTFNEKLGKVPAG